MLFLCVTLNYTKTGAPGGCRCIVSKQKKHWTLIVDVTRTQMSYGDYYGTIGIINYYDGRGWK